MPDASERDPGAPPAQDETAPRLSGNPSGAYVGFSERSRMWILGLGAAIACLNLLVAWYMAHETLTALRLVDADVAPFRTLFNDAQISSESRHDLVARSMHVVALTKMIGNKQGLILACFGGAFGLAAIGFSLFVIGADGAFKVSGSTSAKAKIVMSGTAPGLLCFAICGWLMVRGVEQKSSMELPPFNSSSVWVVPADKETPDSCAKKDGDGRCYSSTEWDKVTQRLKEKKS